MYDVIVQAAQDGHNTAWLSQDHNSHITRGNMAAPYTSKSHRLSAVGGRIQVQDLNTLHH